MQSYFHFQKHLKRPKWPLKAQRAVWSSQQYHQILYKTFSLSHSLLGTVWLVKTSKNYVLVQSLLSQNLALKAAPSNTQLAITLTNNWVFCVCHTLKWLKTLKVRPLIQQEVYVNYLLLRQFCALVQSGLVSVLMFILYGPYQNIGVITIHIGFASGALFHITELAAYFLLNLRTWYSWICQSHIWFH